MAFENEQRVVPNRHPIHLEVRAKYSDENPEALIKRFLRKYKNQKLNKVFREKCAYSAFYEKPSDKARRKRSEMRRKRQEVDAEYSEQSAPKRPFKARKNKPSESSE